MVSDAEFTGKKVFIYGKFGEVDYFDVSLSAGLKGTPFSELLKASTDLRTSGFSSIFDGSKNFSDFAIEGVGIGLSLSPLNKSAIGSEFGLSNSALSIPIARFGEFSFRASESIVLQSTIEYFKNEQTKF